MQLVFGEQWSSDKVYRTTKCFSPKTNGYPGGFPVGFLKWVYNMGWWGEKRCYLCCGNVDDKESIRVDLNKDVNPDYIEDARNTSIADNSFDWIMIDPPYTKDLAISMYNTGEQWGSINQFTKEANRICKPGGIILTLSYEVPKRVKGCDLEVCIGVYQAINVAHIRCFTVWKKEEE